MPLPRILARLNKHVTNRIAVRLPRVGPLAVVVHRGRTSGREYRTPVSAFRCDEGFVIPLTYGADTDWVKNVLHAGAAALEYRGASHAVFRPRVTEREQVVDCLPGFVRPALRATGSSQFLLVRRR